MDVAARRIVLRPACLEVLFSEKDLDLPLSRGLGVWIVNFGDGCCFRGGV